MQELKRKEQRRFVGAHGRNCAFDSGRPRICLYRPQADGGRDDADADERGIEAKLSQLSAIWLSSSLAANGDGVPSV